MKFTRILFVTILSEMTCSAFSDSQDAKQSAPQELKDAAKCKPTSINWRTDYNAARKESESRKLPLVLLLTSECSIPCDRIKRDMMANVELASILNSQTVPLLLVAADESTQMMMNRIGIGAYPALITAAYDGKIIDREVGYQEPVRILEMLQLATKKVERPFMPYAKD